MDDLPRRLPGRAWTAAVVAPLCMYLLMWSFVHSTIDTRPCLLVLPDPFFAVISEDQRWRWVAGPIYQILTPVLILILLWQAWRGDHRMAVRFGLAAAVLAAMRSVTVLLLPLCHPHLEEGEVAVRSVPTLDLGFLEIPWRMIAMNDLFFSGHVGAYLLLYRAVRPWPAWARAGILVVTALEAWALLKTRGHYTLDILVAVPMAFAADYAARWALPRLAGVRYEDSVSRPAG